MVRYYNTTATLGIKYQGNRADASMDDPSHTIDLKAYSDSAHGDNTDRKSSAGYVITMASGLASYKSYRQRLVTLSSTESEYIALTYAAKEVSWVQSEMCFPSSSSWLPSRFRLLTLPATTRERSYTWQ